MTVPSDTLSYSPEIMNRGVVVYRDNDYDHATQEGLGSWHEIEISQLDGRYVVDARQVNFDTTDTNVPRETVTTRQGSSNEQFRNFRDCKSVVQISGDLKPALELAGIDAHVEENAQAEHYRITLPGFDELQERFDLVRARTGYAPRLTEFDGIEFDYPTMAQNESEGILALSNDPPTFVHDVLAYAWTRLLLTEGVEAAKNRRTQTLLSEVRSHKNYPDSRAYQVATSNLDTHLRNLDETLVARHSIGITDMIEGSLEDDQEARSGLAKILKKTTGITRDDFINESIEGLEDRVHELSDLATSLRAARNADVAQAFGRITNHSVPIDGRDELAKRRIQRLGSDFGATLARKLATDDTGGRHLTLVRGENAEEGQGTVPSSKDSPHQVDNLIPFRRRER